MDIQQINAADAPTPTRDSKYAPILDALAGGNSVSVPESEVKMLSLRTAVNRRFPKAYRIYAQNGAVYIVARAGDPAQPEATEADGGEGVESPFPTGL